MKTILILIFLVNSLFSLTINESLLKIHATLIPKISLMDFGYKQKCHNSTLFINIVYEPTNYLSALSLKEQMEHKYKNGINSYKIKVKLSRYDNVKANNANIYYLFPSNSKNIKNVLKIARLNKALTFSYLKKDLKYGVMISLHVGAKVKPILNLDAIRANNITLRPVLLNISTIYLSDENSSLYNIEGALKNQIKIAFLNSSLNWSIF